MLRNIGFSTDRDERKKPYLDFSNNLENDLNTRIATQKALGVKDKDIEQDLVPQEDNTIQERLENYHNLVLYMDYKKGIMKEKFKICYLGKVLGK